MKKTIVIAIALLLLLGVAIAYKLYQKAPDRAEDREAISVKADELAKVFATNEQEARKQYIGKVLAIEGTVTASEKNQEGRQVATISSTADAPTIRATFRDANVSVNTHAAIKLKGFCDAYMPGEDVAGIALPGTILLTDCILIP